MAFLSILEIEKSPESTDEFVRRHSNIFSKIDKFVYCKSCGETFKLTSPCYLRNHMDTDVHQLLVNWPEEERVSFSKKQFVKFANYLKRYPFLTRIGTNLVCLSCNIVFSESDFSKIPKHKHACHNNEGDIIETRGTKRWFETGDKERYINNVLINYPGKLIQNSQGDLVCSTCHQLFKPTDYTQYHKTVRKHFTRSLRHLNALMEENCKGQNDGFVDPPDLSKPRALGHSRIIDIELTKEITKYLLYIGQPLYTADTSQKTVIQALFGTTVSSSYLYTVGLQAYYEGLK